MGQAELWLPNADRVGTVSVALTEIEGRLHGTIAYLPEVSPAEFQDLFSGTTPGQHLRVSLLLGDDAPRPFDCQPPVTLPFPGDPQWALVTEAL